MKQLLRSAFSIRRKLIREKKSYLDPIWAEKQMQKIEYWLATGNAERVVKNHYELIIILLPTNFISKFKEKFDDL